MKVGLIGVGNMGRHYAANILKSGFTLTAYDVVDESLAAAVRLGAKAASAPSEVAKQSDVILLSLPGPREVEDTILRGTILSDLPMGSVIVDLGTTGIETIKKVGEEASKHGIGFLDAPVSGGTKGAETGTLTIMVGGDKQIFEKSRVVLGAIGKNIFHVGPLGAGTVVKLVIQLLVATNLLAVAEAMTLGVKAGVNPRLLFDVVRSSAGDSKMLEYSFPKALERDFTPTSTIKLLRKDLKLARRLGESLDHPLLLCGFAEQLYGIADFEGMANKDELSIFTLIESWSKTSIH
jgi:3-hydroxyisobutyrate dehydrogenase-like beta-hydroxyacid dehydrogenase